MVAHDNLITIEDKWDTDIVAMTTLERLLPDDSHILRALTEPDETPAEARVVLKLEQRDMTLPLTPVVMPDV